MPFNPCPSIPNVPIWSMTMPSKTWISMRTWSSFTAQKLPSRGCNGDADARFESWLSCLVFSCSAWKARCVRWRYRWRDAGSSLGRHAFPWADGGQGQERLPTMNLTDTWGERELQTNFENLRHRFIDIITKILTVVSCWRSDPVDRCIPPNLQPYKYIFFNQFTRSLKLKVSTHSSTAVDRKIYPVIQRMIFFQIPEPRVTNSGALLKVVSCRQNCDD